MIRPGVREKVTMAVTSHKTRSMFNRDNIVNEDDVRDEMVKTSVYANSQSKIQGQKPEGLRGWAP